MKSVGLSQKAWSLSAKVVNQLSRLSQIVHVGYSYIAEVVVEVVLAVVVAVVVDYHYTAEGTNQAALH